MIDPGRHLIVVRGGGDLGSGVIWRLRRVGFPIVVLELERPLTVRRTVAFSSAVTDGTITIDGIEGRRVESAAQAVETATSGVVPVLVAAQIPAFALRASVIVDARLAKRKLDTTIARAPVQLVVKVFSFQVEPSPLAFSNQVTWPFNSPTASTSRWPSPSTSARATADAPV